LAAFHRRLDGGVQRLAQSAALGLKIDERNGIGHNSSARDSTRF
jgi:hypothetical protein